MNDTQNTLGQIRAGGRDGLDSRASWIRLFLSVLVGAVSCVGMWAVVVVLPGVQAEFGVDRAAASLPFTATMIGFGLGNLGFGRFVDRFGVTTALLMAAVFLGIGFSAGALSQDIVQFAIAQGVFIGLGTAVGFGPLIADISHWFEKRRGIAVAAVACGNYIGGAIWPLILKALIAADGWRFTYFVVAIICFVALIPLALLLRKRPPHLQLSDDVSEVRAHTAAPPLAVASQLSPRVLQFALIIAGVACCAAMSMPQVHIVALCADLGYGVARGAEMLSLMLAGGIVSRLLSGYVADYIGGVRTLLIGSCLQCMALFLYIPFDGLISLYIVSFVFGLSQGGIVPSYAVIVREYMPASEAGQRVGIVIFATVVGMALGGWISGWIYDFTGSYDVAFFNGIAWNFLNIFIMLWLLWRTKRSEPGTGKGLAQAA